MSTRLVLGAMCTVAAAVVEIAGSYCAGADEAVEEGVRAAAGGR